MVRYFQFPFAENGDRQAIPDESVTEEVNYANGYTPAYELQKDDPDRRNIDRQPFNSILFDVTANIKQWQDFGYPEFVEDDGTGSPKIYPSGRVVYRDGTLYLAKTEANTTPPSSDWLTLGSPEDALRYQPSPIEVDATGGSDIVLEGASADCESILVTGTLSGNISIIVPIRERLITVINETTGEFTLSVNTPGGSGSAIPSGQLRVLWCDESGASGLVQLSASQVAYGNGTVADTLNVLNERSLSRSGYQKLPGGLILQWGVIENVGQTEVSANYPVPFTTSVFVVVPGEISSDTSQSVVDRIYWDEAGSNNTQVRIGRDTDGGFAGTLDITFFAIGI